MKHLAGLQGGQKLFCNYNKILTEKCFLHKAARTGLITVFVEDFQVFLDTE